MENTKKMLVVVAVSLLAGGVIGYFTGQRSAGVGPLATLEGVQSSASSTYSARMQNRNTISYDVNRDGTEDYNDSKYIARFAAGLEKECPLALCDITRNGTISALDAARLAQALIVKYDINADTKFTTLDPEYIARFAAGLETGCTLKKCDITKDGTISALDAARLSQILATFTQ